MTQFLIQIAANGFTEDVRIEAKTIEEAVTIAQRDHCAPRQITVTPRPTWAEPVPEGGIVDELSHEIMDYCADCGEVIFNIGGTDRGWPWSHTSGDENCYTCICYPCAMRRKELGNYCGHYENYYRYEHHTGAEPGLCDCGKTKVA